MSVTQYTIKQLFWNSLFGDQINQDNTKVNHFPTQQKKFDLWQPLRQWLNQIEVKNPRLAHRICDLVPAQCPFHRKIRLFGRTLITIPPMCQLNPVYNEIMSLRFRAICYLADECGEDVSAYC